MDLRHCLLTGSQRAAALDVSAWWAASAGMRLFGMAAGMLTLLLPMAQDWPPEPSSVLRPLGPTILPPAAIIPILPVIRRIAMHGARSHESHSAAGPEQDKLCACVTIIVIFWASVRFAS